MALTAEQLKAAATLRMRMNSKGRVPTYAEIADKLGVPKAEVQAELKVFFAAIEAALENGTNMELPWLKENNNGTA